MTKDEEIEDLKQQLAAAKAELQGIRDNQLLGDKVQQAEDRIAELVCIKDNVAAALYPNTDKLTRNAEMMLDGGGAVDTIKNLRAAREQAGKIRESAQAFVEVLATEGCLSAAKAEYESLRAALEVKP